MSKRGRDPAVTAVAPVSLTRSLRGLVAVSIAGLLAAALLLSGCGTLTTSPAAGTFTPRTRGCSPWSPPTSRRRASGPGPSTTRPADFEYELARDLAQRFGLKSVQREARPLPPRGRWSSRRRRPRPRPDHPDQRTRAECSTSPSPYLDARADRGGALRGRAFRTWPPPRRCNGERSGRQRWSTIVNTL